MGLDEARRQIAAAQWLQAWRGMVMPTAIPAHEVPPPVVRLPLTAEDLRWLKAIGVKAA